VLATNSVNEVDAGVIRNSSIFEFSLNRDDVGRVTEGGESLAEQFTGFVFEEVSSGGRDVEKSSFEGENVDQVVGLCERGRVWVSGPEESEG
jgi:hypothetical protein